MGLLKFLRSFGSSQEQNDFQASMNAEGSPGHGRLEEACARHVTVGVFLEGNHAEFRSRLARIKETQEESCLLIDPLSPREGNGLLEKRGASIRIEYVLEGTEYVFEAQFMREVQGPPPALALTYPALVSLKHLRRYLRVSPPSGEPVNFSFETSSGQKVSGHIADLSGGGFGFSASLVVEPLPLGTILTKVKLAMPTGEVAMAKAVLRNMNPKYSARGAELQYGVEFTGILEADLAAIMRYINQTQPGRQAQSGRPLGVR